MNQIVAKILLSFMMVFANFYDRLIETECDKLAGKAAKPNTMKA